MGSQIPFRLFPGFVFANYWSTARRQQVDLLTDAKRREFADALIAHPLPAEFLRRAAALVFSPLRSYPQVEPVNLLGSHSATVVGHHDLVAAVLDFALDARSQ